MKFYMLIIGLVIAGVCDIVWAGDESVEYIRLSTHPVEDDGEVPLNVRLLVDDASLYDIGYTTRNMSFVDDFGNSIFAERSFSSDCAGVPPAWFVPSRDLDPNTQYAVKDSSSGNKVSVFSTGDIVDNEAPEFSITAPPEVIHIGSDAGVYSPADFSWTFTGSSDIVAVGMQFNIFLGTYSALVSPEGNILRFEDYSAPECGTVNFTAWDWAGNSTHIDYVISDSDECYNFNDDSGCSCNIVASPNPSSSLLLRILSVWLH